MNVIIRIPRTPPSLNELRGKFKNIHEYQRLRDSIQSDIFHLTKKVDVRGLRAHKDLKHRAKVLILVERKKLLDKDNLYGGIKPLLDALVRLEFIVDDSAKWIDLDVTQEKSNDPQTVISIESLGKEIPR